MLLAIFTAGPAAIAADFQAVPGPRDDVLNPVWDWSNPKCWLDAAKKNGVPATSADVGIIGAGHQIATYAPLGPPNSLPTIRVDPGGTLYILNDMTNPLTLAGGTVNGAWIGRGVNGPVTVTTDSEICSRDDAFGLQIHVAGPVTNTRPLTLHIQGCVDWHSDSSKTLTSKIDVDRGYLYVSLPRGSDALGTGPILLATATRFAVHETIHDNLYLLNNDVTGDGSILVGATGPWCNLVCGGVTLHPGQPNQPGTLGVIGSIDFQRNAKGAPCKLIIEVQGDGSTLARDYGQLAVAGKASDTLGNLDLIVRLKPDITADQAAQLHLIVLTTTTDDLTKPNVKPLHSVVVTAGDRTGSATTKLKLDPITGAGVVEVSGIVLK
jgi:hypothetical protein